MDILGVWDGHDSGAALVRDGKLIVAVNEERFTRRKLEIHFPKHSIKACLNQAGIKPQDIKHIAYSTVDFSKTLTRMFPYMREKYYLFRRRKGSRPKIENFRRFFKYWSTEIPEVPFTRSLSNRHMKKKLKSMGFSGFKLHAIDHHTCHIAAVALTGGFKKSLVVTLDGVGDGLAGTINAYENGEFNQISEIKAKDSLGIFYEQVATLLGMRELEDEGKVMALANFAYQIPDDKNKLLDFFEVDGLDIKCRYTTLGKYNRLKDVLWNTPREDFAYMAQRTLEVHSTRLFENALEEAGLGNVCISGGVASNIKMNMKVRHLPQVKDWFVFPHMGDGGLAAGAALQVSHELGEAKPHRLEDCYLGVSHPHDAVEEAVKKSGFEYERRSDAAKYAGELIGDGDFVFWWQGRMEFGPRALGNRSILAPAGDLDVKDRLNLQVKMRSWFQPFCPSMLAEEAGKVFADYDSRDAFMTMGYMTRPEMMDSVSAVVNVDGSARPQMIEKENPRFRTLIESAKKNTGLGVVLNTSFNIHGYPIVDTPEQALEVLKVTGTRYLFLDDFMVENRG